MIVRVLIGREAVEVAEARWLGRDGLVEKRKHGHQGYLDKTQLIIAHDTILRNPAHHFYL